jgi:hypothetical protein
MVGGEPRCGQCHDGPKGELHRGREAVGLQLGLGLGLGLEGELHQGRESQEGD